MSSPSTPPPVTSGPQVAAFLGSPRRGGNTDTLADMVLSGAAAAGLSGESYALRRLGVGPCTGCERCWSAAGPCVLDDGMEAAEPLVRMFELSFRYLELRFAERLLVDEAGGKGAVAGRPEVLARARLVGAALARHRTPGGTEKGEVRP